MLLNRNNPHGGDIYAHPVQLDVSANINPAGMPAPVRDALHRAADACTGYPDPSCTRLRQGLSEAEHVPASWILCGNGAADLIYPYAAVLAPNQPALLVTPTFCEYEQAWRAFGGSAVYAPLSPAAGFQLTEEVLPPDIDRYRAVFLCSPNNPTGRTVPPEQLLRLLETGVRVFLDACFLDLTETPALYDFPALLRTYPHLFVLRAFTKSYAMAGVRLGYGLCSDTEFLAAMAEKVPCWNVSTLAQEAGCAALGCADWLRDSVQAIAAERERLRQALSALGITVFPGEANYLLLRTDRPLFRPLLERGILVRDCGNYPGLDSTYLRIAVRTPDENTQVLSAFKEVVS